MVKYQNAKILKKVVIDTNILLVSVSSKSPYHWVFKLLLDGNYILCVTTDILLEYSEIIERHMGKDVAENVLATLENLPNINRVTKYFHFHLLRDEDDDKFVDCAIASNADFIVSHDKDFKILATIEFPKVDVISLEAFQKEMKKS